MIIIRFTIIQKRIYIFFTLISDPAETITEHSSADNGSCPSFAKRKSNRCSSKNF